MIKHTTESKSLRKLKTSLIKRIPRFPNTKETLQALENQHLNLILLHYIHWASRYVPARSRRITYENYALNDPRWESLSGQIDDFLLKVETGGDLTPYLSKKPHTEGYEVKVIDDRSNPDTWTDKDFLLNVMGLHHFHLVPAETGRTNVVLFAEVTRTEFHVVALFDHSVFDCEITANREMESDERNRLWTIFREYSSRGIPSGSAYCFTDIAYSGHPGHIVDMSRDYIRVIEQFDSKLEDKDFISSLYEGTCVDIPKKNKLEWDMKGLDLCLVDKNKNFYVLRYGSI